MRAGDINRDLIETGLSRDIVVWAEVGMLRENGNAARDFVTRFSTRNPDDIRIGQLGEVQTIELDRADLLAERPNPHLHIISTHRGLDWEGCTQAIEAWLGEIHKIISARAPDNHGLEALQSLIKSMDRDHLTLEDAELLRVFWEAALGPIVASVMIGVGSKERSCGDAPVPLRAILATMALSKLWTNIKVILPKNSHPAFFASGLIPVPKPLLSPDARAKVMRVLKYGMPA